MQASMLRLLAHGRVGPTKFQTRRPSPAKTGRLPVAVMMHQPRAPGVCPRRVTPPAATHRLYTLLGLTVLRLYGDLPPATESPLF